MVSDMDWTEEAIARLRAFWRDGHSTSEIGRRMGIGKNAVVGKAHRLGLPSRPSPIPGRGTGERPGLRARSDPGDPEMPPQPSRQLAPTKPAAPARPAAPVPVRAVSGNPCCWPIGEPGTRGFRTRGFRTCDAPAQPRKPYCAEHVEAAYVPAAAARDRPDGHSLDRFLKRQLTRVA